jgi:anionic cell wall polymer biosynthesis LytR-Cps2A-Psr (LCP) family protein
LRLLTKDASGILLALIIILLSVGIIIGLYTLRSNPVDDALAGNRVINILFIIEDNKMPLSTYALMYYPSTRRAAVFDIPGELGLLLTKINRVDRIDRVYDPAKIGAYELEVQKLLGIELNFTIVITKDKLISLVDLLEGVELFIPSPVSYRDEDELIMFPSGITVLDGDKAGVYITYSLSDEDLEMEVFRRQRFFQGLLDRWLRVNEILKNKEAARLYYSFFKTSMNQRTMMRLFDELAHIDTSRFNIQSVGGNLREVSGQTLIIPHWDGSLVKEIVRQTLGTLTREVEGSMNERTPTVEVLNGTAITGLAGRTAEMLRSFGFDVISIGNADRGNYDSTLIIHRSGDDSMLNDFASVIRCTNIRRELSLQDRQDELEEMQNFVTGNFSPQSFEYKADFTLIIGRNFNGRYVIGN